MRKSHILFLFAFFLFLLGFVLTFVMIALPLDSAGDFSSYRSIFLLAGFIIDLVSVVLIFIFTIALLKAKRKEKENEADKKTNAAATETSFGTLSSLEHKESQRARTYLIYMAIGTRGLTVFNLLLFAGGLTLIVLHLFEILPGTWVIMIGHIFLWFGVFCLLYFYLLYPLVAKSNAKKGISKYRLDLYDDHLTIVKITHVKGEDVSTKKEIKYRDIFKVKVRHDILSFSTRTERGKKDNIVLDLLTLTETEKKILKYRLPRH